MGLMEGTGYDRVNEGYVGENIKTHHREIGGVEGTILRLSLEKKQAIIYSNGKEIILKQVELSQGNHGLALRLDNDKSDLKFK